MGYMVTRQLYWYSKQATVEVTSGGLDYAGADALSPKYRHLGEFDEFSDPREAVAAAIEICRQWRKDGEKRAKVACGSTGGMGMEIEPDTFKKALIWADRMYSQLPRCDGCGEIMGKEKWHADDWSGSEFCSERCAEKEAEYQAEEEEKFRQEEAEI